LKNIYYEVQELSRDISELNSDVYFDESERNYVEERLDMIYTLKRKYGNSVEEIIEYKEKIEKEIERINNLDEHNEMLKKEIKEIEEKMWKIAKKMHEIRLKFSEILNEKINKELYELEMLNAKFIVNISKEDFDKNGTDYVQ